MSNRIRRCTDQQSTRWWTPTRTPMTFKRSRLCRSKCSMCSTKTRFAHWSSFTTWPSLYRRRREATLTSTCSWPTISPTRKSKGLRSQSLKSPRSSWTNASSASFKASCKVCKISSMPQSYLSFKWQTWCNSSTSNITTLSFRTETSLWWRASKIWSVFTKQSHRRAIRK